MPRAIDPRNMQLTHDPTRSGTEFHMQGLIKSEAEILVELLGTFGDTIKNGIIDAIQDLTGIDLTEFLGVFDDLALDFSSPEAFIESFGAALISLGSLLLGANSPLNALNLFNIVPPTNLGHIDVSAIGKFVTNLLTDPNFLDETLFSGSDIWFHDPFGGFGGTGAAYTTANGTTKELLGNLIPVSEGQILPISGRVKWTGLVGTGTPIGLGATGYQGGNPVHQQTIASHNTTPATTDWLTLSGQYTVPANVDGVRTRLIVDSAATAGTVSFSTLSATKIGAMFQRLIQGTNAGELLPDDITHLFTGIITNTMSLLNKVEQSAHDALVNVIGGDFGDDLAAAEQRLEDFLHSLSPLNGSNINSGTIGNQWVPGVTNLHDNIVAAVGNMGGTGFDITKVFEVLTGQTSSVLGHGAGVIEALSRLSNLESKVAALPIASGGTGSGTADGGVIGVVDTDGFERTSSSNLGAQWSVSYKGGAGTWATPNGHDATFATNGVADRDFLCIRNNPAVPRSQTNFQRVTQELSGKSGRFYDSILGTYNYTGHTDAWLRISDATTNINDVTGIRVRWGGDGTISIVQFVNGTGSLLGSRPIWFIPPPGPGALLIGEAGVLTDNAPLHIRARVGTSIVLEADTPVTPGSTSRRWGHGGRAEGHLLPLPGQEPPAGLHYWNGMDQTT